MSPVLKFTMYSQERIIIQDFMLMTSDQQKAALVAVKKIREKQFVSVIRHDNDVEITLALTRLAA